MVRPTDPFGEHARAKGDEKLVQLLERLAHRIRRLGAGSVERFLRAVELVQDQQRLSTLFLEGQLTTFKTECAKSTRCAGRGRARGARSMRAPR